jgi:hypothetical protein
MKTQTALIIPIILLTILSCKDDCNPKVIGSPENLDKIEKKDNKKKCSRYYILPPTRKKSRIWFFYYSKLFKSGKKHEQ